MKKIIFIISAICITTVFNACNDEPEPIVGAEVVPIDVYFFPYEGTQTDNEGLAWEVEMPEDGGELFIFSTKFAQKMPTLQITEIEVNDDDKYQTKFIPQLEDYEILYLHPKHTLEDGYGLPSSALYSLNTEWGTFSYQEYGKFNCILPQLPEKVWKTRKIKIVIEADVVCYHYYSEVTIIQHNTQYNPYP